MNRLIFGDCLEVMRDSVPPGSVDLVYLDPPFNSKQEYNVYLEGSKAQATAFRDTWTWTEDAHASLRHVAENDRGLHEVITGVRDFMRMAPMSAYMAYMAARLIEARRALKDAGSLYLHCDPSASHYLKIAADAVFGADRFVNEIAWKRTSAHSNVRGYGRIHDCILFYSKSGDFTWNRTFTGYGEEYVRKFYRQADKDGRLFQAGDLMAAGKRQGESGMPWRGIDPAARGNHWAIRRSFLNDPDLPAAPLAALDYLDSIGRIHWPEKGGVPRIKRYLDEMPGAAPQDMFLDIPPLSAKSREKLGYPTQKPVKLLERLISASSNPGDVVLDPFCGCGTSLEAAERLGRKWIGIDVTHIAVALVERRLKDAFSREEGFAFEVEGAPKDIDAARDLAERDRLQFQYWACSLLLARPVDRPKKGGDQGVDGVMFFNDEGPKAPLKKIVISVKSGGNLNPGMVRDLAGTVRREKAVMGIFLTLAEPTKGMLQEATASGEYVSPLNRERYPAVQIVTVQKLLGGGRPKLPPDLTSGEASHRKNRAAARGPEPKGLDIAALDSPE